MRATGTGCRSDEQTASVLLAAGGTGGHLFPASGAGRGAGAPRHRRRPRHRHARRPLRHGISRAQHSSACPRRRSPANRRRHGAHGRAAVARPHRAFEILGQVKPSASSASAAIRRFRRCWRRACAASRPRCTSRTRCSAAPTACWPKGVTAIATSFERRSSARRRAWSTSRASPAIRCATSSSRRPGGPIVPPSAGGRLDAAGVRRQPGRALLLRRRAAGAGAAADGNPRPARGGAASARGGSRARVAAAYRASGIAAEVSHVLHGSAERMAQSHLVIAAFRRLDRRRT